jgi:hypothetical protein
MDYQMATLVKRIFYCFVIIQLAWLENTFAQNTPDTKQLEEIKVKEKKRDINGLRGPECKSGY